MPPGESRKDNRKRIVSRKTKLVEKEAGKRRQSLGFAGSVARGWCDIKNILEFSGLHISSGKRYCRRLAGHGSFRRINTRMDSFLILGRFQGDLQGTVRYGLD